MQLSGGLSHMVDQNEHTGGIFVCFVEPVEAVIIQGKEGVGAVFVQESCVVLLGEAKVDIREGRVGAMQLLDH